MNEMEKEIKQQIKDELRSEMAAQEQPNKYSLLIVMILFGLGAIFLIHGPGIVIEYIIGIGMALLIGIAFLLRFAGIKEQVKTGTVISASAAPVIRSKFLSKLFIYSLVGTIVLYFFQEHAQTILSVAIGGLMLFSGFNRLLWGLGRGKTSGENVAVIGLISLLMIGVGVVIMIAINYELLGAFMIGFAILEWCGYAYYKKYVVTTKIDTSETEKAHD